MLSKYHYYTGIIFQAYTYGTGEALIKGGRYNQLMKHFGKPAASIGFAIVVDNLLMALSRQKIEMEEEEGVTAVSYTHLYEPIILPSFDEVQADKQAYARSFAIQYQNTDPFTAGTMAEFYGTKGYVIQNPPALPLTQEEMDDVYDLPYAGNYHPMYEKDGGIPALEEIKFSLTSNRGCFGSCSFCALTFHQGRILQDVYKRQIIW